MTDKPTLDQYGDIRAFTGQLDRLTSLIRRADHKDCPESALEAILEVHHLTAPPDPEPCRPNEDDTMSGLRDSGLTVLRQSVEDLRAAHAIRLDELRRRIADLEEKANHDHPLR